MAVACSPLLARAQLRHRWRQLPGAAAAELLRLGRGRSQRRFIFLMYHKILPDELAADYPLSNLVVPLTRFRSQLAWLKRHWRPVTVSQALAEVRGQVRGDPPGELGPSFPSKAKQPGSDARPTICITFDDGYADNALYAAPALAEADCPATFFVTTGFVQGQSLWPDVVGYAWQQLGPQGVFGTAAASPHEAEPASLEGWLRQLKQASPDQRQATTAALRQRVEPLPTGPMFDPMSPTQLQALADGGHEIGSHTMTHPMLPQCEDAMLYNELHQSRQTLEHWLGREVTGLCYPNGDHNTRVTAAARAAGYHYGCTTEPGGNTAETDPFALRRRMIRVDPSRATEHFQLASFVSQVMGWREPLRRLRRSAKRYRPI